MIKKILCAFLMIMVSGIANANIHIDGKTVRKIVLEHIDSEHQVPALQEYNVQLKATGNFTMSAAGLYKVCTAAGWDIATPDGKTKCDNFVKALVAESDYKYYEICGKDKGKSGGTEYCVDNVFYSLIGGIQVTMLQADGLCKEYARVKYNDDIECSTNTRKGTINPLNDYVKCTSKLKPIYYEFKFDDVVESSDKTVLKGVLKGVGKLYNVDISDPGCTVERMINNTACSIGYKTTDTNICNQINNSLKTFGYTSKVENVSRAGLNSEKLCGVHNIIMTSSNLKTAYGIPNDVFYDGIIQMQGSKDIKEGIKQYVTEKIKPEALTSFECISNTIKMPSIKGKKDNDDVLTCYVNGNQIDFVFDDLSEASKLRQQGAKEAFQCTYNGGLMTGKRCLNVGEEACKKIAQSTFLVQECPDCSKLYWDGNMCTLPGAAVSNALDKGLNIALIVGGAALNIFVAIGTGGTSTAVGGGLLFVETVGSAIELGTEIKMDLAADKFFVESSKCHDKTCANDLIKKHLQRLSNFYTRLTYAEEKAVDHEMARLFKLIPAEELFTVEALVKVDQENGGKKLASVKDNQKGFFDSKSWESEQIWQAVGITMQMASLFYQIGSWAFGKSGKTAKAMTEVADVLDDKADDGLKQLREKGLNVELDDKGRIVFKDQLNHDIMSSFSDISDEAGRMRIQAMKEKYGIKFHDGGTSLYIPDGIGDIMRKELGDSNVEKEFYEEVRNFIYEYHGLLGDPVDIGDFRRVEELTPSTPLSTEKTAALREKFGLAPKTTNATSSVDDAITSGSNSATQRHSGFNMGDNTHTTTTKSEPQTSFRDKIKALNEKYAGQTPDQSAIPVSSTPTQKRSWAEIQAAAEDAGRARIEKFKEKYNLSMENRRKYTKEQWEQILDQELGYSDIEDVFRKDFRNGMSNFYWNQ